MGSTLGPYVRLLDVDQLTLCHVQTPGWEVDSLGRFGAVGSSSEPIGSSRAIANPGGVAGGRSQCGGPGLVRKRTPSVSDTHCASARARLSSSQGVASPPPSHEGFRRQPMREDCPCDAYSFCHCSPPC